MLDVRQCKVAEIFGDENFSEISHAYSEECALAGLPIPVPHAETYQTLESFCGQAFVVLGAFHENRLVGFIVLMTAINPHYGQLFCSSESFFVLPCFRKTGAGFRLLNEARRIAKERGAIALKVSAMVGSKLDEILQQTDSAHTNNIYTVQL